MELHRDTKKSAFRHLPKGSASHSRDLVFFHPGPSGPGHVGIYIGGGQFLHAPHTGDVVKISSLDEYAVSYVGAVRPY